MKTKFMNKTIILVALVMAFTACSKDFLEEIPRLSQSNELSLSTYAGLESATVGAYSLFCSQFWYGAEFVITADLKGGNAKRGPLNSGRYVNEYLWNNNASSTSGLWNDAYSTIARANNVLNTISGGFRETGVTREQLDQLKGECFFIRALAHWDLVRMYAQPYAAGTSNLGVPVILVTENGYPARNTVGEVYERVVEDLDSAEVLLAAVNPRGNNDGAWVTSWAAKALLAKVYLYMGMWQEAADNATDVINNGGFSLFTAAEYTTWDNDGYWGSGGAGSEIIFQVDGSQGNTDSGFWESISFMVSPVGYGDIATSNDLLSLYEAGDVRADLFVNPANFPSDYWTLKYPGRLGSSPPIDFNTPVLRLAEMYLIRAEAQLNGAIVASVTAKSDYDAVRTKRGLAVSATAPALADIYAERRRELCFEGNELFDLARTQRSLSRTDFNGSLNKDVPFVVGGTAIQNYLWAMPIPQAEVDANTNMVQNPEY